MKLVSSFALSRLDYCKSLRAGLPENRPDRLQTTQNSAACLVLSLADEAETMQSLCSGPSTGCQSELGLSTRFPPLAIVAETHLLLPNCLIFLSAFQVSAFRKRRSHDCSTHHTQQVWKACFFMHRTSDRQFPPQTSTSPKSPSISFFKSSLKTFLIKKHRY